jgi:hypothetical protein
MTVKTTTMSDRNIESTAVKELFAASRLGRVAAVAVSLLWSTSAAASGVAATVGCD